jgi:recombination protein RecT
MSEPSKSIQRHDEGALAALLRKATPGIAQALPKHLNADRMCRIALTALRTTPKLAECTPASFLGSIIQASQLGLEVNTPLGQAYLIPFKQTCQLIIGYQGMMDLARRSGQVRAIYAFAVFDGDRFSYSLGLNPTVEHAPAGVTRDPKKITHVYAVAKLLDGEPVFTVLTRADVEAARARSLAKNSGPWVTDYEAMAVKTAVRRLFKWLPKSAEMAIAASVDESLETQRSQLSAMDPAVQDLLLTQGVDTSEMDEQAADAEPPAVASPEQDGQRIKLGGKKDQAPKSDTNGDA